MRGFTVDWMVDEAGRQGRYVLMTPMWGHSYPREYERRPAKPVFEGEPAYEDMIDGFFSGPKDGSGTRMDADVVQPKACWGVFAGGFGHTYGHNDVQIFWSPGKPQEAANRNPWRDALQAPGAAQMQHLRALIESRPFLGHFPRRPRRSPGPDARDVRLPRCGD